VYAAKDIHDDVRDGMDPDCLFVGLEKFEALSADRDEWEKRCKRLVGVLSVYGLSPQAVAMIAEGSMEAENDWRRTL
jgi:hypothetical protein